MTCLFAFYLIIWTCCQTVAAHAIQASGNTPRPRGIHLPIVRNGLRTFKKRANGSTAIGLGDVLDVTYNVLVQIGSIQTPLVLDTGSSDLWVLSDQCTGTCTEGVPLYPHSSTTQTGLTVQLLYGDSHTGTHAIGPIVKDTVGIAGLSVKDLFLAAIVDTNTTTWETGSAGILGLGFPAISVLWRQLLQAQLSNQPPSFGGSPAFLRSTNVNYNQPSFPDFTFLSSAQSTTDPLFRRQSSPLLSSAEVIASFNTFGPLPARFISEHLLSSPLIAVTLQRDTVDIGGNVGLLSIGELPAGIRSDALTWLPVRAYTAADGGLPPSPEAPNEVFPLVWEVPLDDVYFDGIKLARSSLSPSNISLSALIDTGNSLIRGPQDVIYQIQRILGNSIFDCSRPHNLTFQIGGKLFPVDPRDFIHQAFSDSVDLCTPALAITDPPGSGFLYSWSLGDPFLKSALVAFYYGNLTHPSRDPPRIGLLSTLPQGADERLKEIVSQAQEGNNDFIATSEPAPSGTFIATTTGVGGVPQATRPLSNPNSSNPNSSGALPVHPMWGWSTVLPGTITLVFFFWTVMVVS